MRIESLEYFLMAEKCKSFSKAAANLFISPQGLQRAISALEAETSLRLFKREGRFIVPTEDGRIFSAFARDVVQRTNEFKAAIAQVKEYDNTPLSSLCISAMPYASTQFYDVMWHSIADRRLDACVIDEVGVSEIFEMLDRGLEDELILFALPSEQIGKLRKYASEVEIVPLCRLELMVFGGRKLLSPKKTSVSVKELTELPLAYYNDAVLDYFVSRMPGVGREVIQRSSNVERILNLVRSEEAVTFSDTLSDYMAQKSADNSGFGISLPIRPACTVYLGFALSKRLPEDSVQREATRRFHELLETECGSYMQHYAWNI